MIDTENLTKIFGGSTAVDSITLHVYKGEVFGFLGPNGAGKTTIVRMLACLVSKNSGSATIRYFRHLRYCRHAAHRRDWISAHRQLLHSPVRQGSRRSSCPWTDGFILGLVHCRRCCHPDRHCVIWPCWREDSEELGIMLATPMSDGGILLGKTLSACPHGGALRWLHSVHGATGPLHAQPAWVPLLSELGHLSHPPCRTLCGAAQRGSECDNRIKVDRRALRPAVRSLAHAPVHLSVSRL